MKKLLSTIMIFLLGFTISGCGSSANKSECGNYPTEVIVVTDTGGIHDKSFNQGTWEGIEGMCSTDGFGAEYIETQKEDEIETNLRKAAEKAKIVVASGFLFEKAVAKVAQEFPDVSFIIIDGQPTDEAGNVLTLDNVHAYFFEEVEAGYLVGFIAGKMTKTNKIGFIGGLEIPAVQKFGWGYLQGAQAANPNLEVEYKYTGSFTDTALGLSTAKSFIASGCDIIFTAAGGVNNGVVEAAIEESQAGHSTYVIGVDRDMYEDGVYEDGKSVILTSAVKYTGKAAEEAIRQIRAGESPQAVTILDVSSGAIGIPETNPNLEGEEATISEAKESLSKALADGSLKTTKEEVQAGLTIKVIGNI